jgi:predicted lipid-binding transport protein (Tim44 family)
MFAMSFDVLFIGIVVGGIALSAIYIGAEYRSWRNRGAAERRRVSILRELHAASLSQQHSADLGPSLVQMQRFTASAGAAGDEVADGLRRSQARSASQRTQPFVDRRTQERHQAMN